MPGADESGELADSSIAAAILEIAGGTPDAAESDGAGPEKRKATKVEKRKTTPARVADETEENDENSDEPAAETDEDQPADEQPEGETETDEESEADEPEGEQPEGAAADDAEPEADETPKWAQKRFAELTGQIRNLRQENEQLKQTSNGQAAAKPAHVDLELLQAETPEQIAQLRERFQDVEEWAELNRDGVEANPDNPELTPYSREQVSQARVNARKKLREIDAREKQLEHTQRFNAAAHQIFPGFNDPDSEFARALSGVLRDVPEIRRLPNYRIIVGDALLGAQVRAKQAQLQAAAKKGPNGKPLPGKPAAGAVRKAPASVNGAPARGNPAPATGKVAVLQKARERAWRTGSEADIAHLVEASRG